MTQIDSIANKNKHWFIGDSTIKINENDSIIGKGGASLKYYLYHPNDAIIKNLPKEKRRTIDFGENQQLIKGTYHQSIHYNDNRGSEITFIELYYNDKELIYVKFRIDTNHDGEIKTLTNQFKIVNGTVPDIIPFEVKNLIFEKNTEILEHYKEDDVNRN